MKIRSLSEELSSTSYPGRGIIIGRTPDRAKAAIAYFIMGRSANSRNRVFVEDGEGIRTQAFDPSKLEDPSLIFMRRSAFSATRQSLPTATRPIPSTTLWTSSTLLSRL